MTDAVSLRSLRDRPYELPRIYTAMDTLPLFACRLAGLTRLRADEPSGPGPP